MYDNNEKKSDGNGTLYDCTVRKETPTRCRIGHAFTRQFKIHNAHISDSRLLVINGY